ncbi:ABC-type xenobiotic transporter [Ranunculus cassubicifolius]
MGDKGSLNEAKKNTKRNPFQSIFMHADSVDMLLMVLGLFGSIGDGFSTPLSMLITSKAMNNIGAGPGNDHDQFLRDMTKVAVYFLYLACGNFFVCFLEGFCWTRTGERQTSRMRHRYLKAVLRQEVSYFDLKVAHTSEVVNSVSNDTLVIQDVIGEKVPHFVMSVAMFFGGYITAFALLWRLAIVGLPFSLLLIVPGLMYGRILMGLARKMKEEYNIAGSVVEQAISSIRTVYSFIGENKTLNNFSRALDGSVKLGLKQGLVKGVAIGSNGITFAIWAFMSWYSSRLVMHHHGEGGTIFAVGVLITIGGMSLGSALSDIKYLSDAYSAGERIREVIKRVPEIDAYNLEGDILPSVSGEVEFKSIRFAYPSRPDSMVLQDFHLRIPAGKTVALVGGSGSGKSTVISLLQRFYNPVGGQILLDRTPINKLQLTWFRSQMGLVSQEPALFAISIRENILFSKEDATLEEVIAAAKASNAHDFISQLPQGYDTQVGEGGVQMSGGQKQRIAIARAIIKAPKILLLDEATSALDSESERVVQEALENASLGRTTLVIAHRLSTIHNADVIAVVQNGQVVETGAHNELIQYDNGLYASLVSLQQMQNTTDGENNTAIASSHVAYKDNDHSSQRLAPVNRSSSENSESGRQVTSVEGNMANDLPAPSFKRLLLLNAPEWRQACVGCISALLFGAVQPVYSLVMGTMISIYFLTDQDEIRSKTRTYSLTFVGLAVFSLVINICQHYSFAAMGEYLTKRIRERMLAKILTFEIEWFDQYENSSGAICSRLARDASAVRTLVGDRMSLIIQALSAVTLAATLGLIIAWRLAIVMIAIQPFIMVSFYYRKVLLKRMSSIAVASQDESSKLAAEAVSNLRTVTAFSSQSRILQMLDRSQDGPQKENIRQSWFAGIGLGVSRGITTCGMALNFWYAGKLISQDHLTSKQLFQTFIMLVSTGHMIADAASMTTDLARSASAVGSVFAVLDRYTQIDSEDTEGYKPEKVKGHIELQDIHFAYPARADVIIFKSFSLSIEASQSTALVGQSGSGKSTIISLIERFYDPLKGAVTIDGRDVKSYHLKSLRKHIALVSQEPTLFGCTIRENIVYGASDKVDEAEIINAAKAANAHDFIAGLKDGYDTWCGDRGLQLSGGQKQRIAIARAILVNPTILLLDEATSALDSQSEKVVQEALDRVMVGRTSVVVAHRLSTIQNCDAIAVLDKGVLVEKGSHSALLAKGPSGAYYGLVRILQQKLTT